jgi:hypothetical protein
MDMEYLWWLKRIRAGFCNGQVPNPAIIESHAQDFAEISLRLDTTISAALPFHVKS